MTIDEPTPEMIAAGWRAAAAGESPITIYRAMRAACTADEHSEAERIAWRRIVADDREVATIQTFGEVTLRNSHPVWVRDADGRVYEAVWTVDEKRRGYWWDTEGESPADPIEICPHPLTEAARERDALTCFVCGVPFAADDICATDINEGTAHAECLEGSAIVDLATGEPSEGPMATWRYGDRA